MAARRKPTLEDVLDDPTPEAKVPGADLFGPLPPKIEHEERSYLAKFAKVRQLVNQSIGLAQLMIGQMRLEHRLDEIEAKLDALLEEK